MEIIRFRWELGKLSRLKTKLRHELGSSLASVCSSKFQRISLHERKAKRIKDLLVLTHQKKQLSKFRLYPLLPLCSVNQQHEIISVQIE
jgi:hypothetical protein